MRYGWWPNRAHSTRGFFSSSSFFYIFLFSLSTELKVSSGTATSARHRTGGVDTHSPPSSHPPLYFPLNPSSFLLRWPSTTAMLSSTSGVLWTDVCPFLHIVCDIRADTLIFFPFPSAYARFLYISARVSLPPIQHDIHDSFVSCVFVRLSHADFSFPEKGRLRLDDCCG